MSKKKSNAQKRAIAEKQKINRARKAEKLRSILFRDFSDITPVPQYIQDMINEYMVGYKRRRILARDFSSMRQMPYWAKISFYKIFTDLDNKIEAITRRELLFKKF